MAKQIGFSLFDHSIVSATGKDSTQKDYRKKNFNISHCVVEFYRTEQSSVIFSRQIYKNIRRQKKL
jgi:hypothetical protein